MALKIKRSVHIVVKVDASFKKQYILFVNKIISDLKERLLTYTMSLKSKRADKDYHHYILEKRNETTLQIEQFNEQIKKIKLIKDGDNFKLSTIDGFFELTEGASIFSLLAPVIVEVVDQKVDRITV